MKDFVVIGVSHHAAPLALREKLAVTGDAQRSLLTRWAERAAGEGVVLSTCNRVELYATTATPGAAMQSARALLRERLDEHGTGAVGADELDAALYDHRGEAAVRHLFRVTSSLDSLVVGEPQILGQVKQAFDAARETGTVGSLLDRCFTRSFSVAKRVRTETGIAEGAVSVSSIAGTLAKKIFGELRGRRVLLLGAGEMGEAAARNLSHTGAVLRVVNRSAAKAHAVAAECGGEARGYEQLASELVAADVVISSTSSDRYVLTTDLMRDVLRARRHRPIFLIDIAVPRDIDPRVGSMESVFLFDVDDLKEVAEENLALRRQAAQAAERIIDVEVAELEAWRRTLDLTPTIVGLRDRFAEIVHGELQRSMQRLDLDEKERRALERMGDAVVKKLLHAPLATLKKTAQESSHGSLIASTRQLFALDSEAQTPNQGDRDRTEAGSTAKLVPDER